MRSSYCVWAPGRGGVSARGRGVVISSLSCCRSQTACVMQVMYS
jgi:hypothetical protein